VKRWKIFLLNQIKLSFSILYDLFWACPLKASGRAFVPNPPPKVKNFIRASFHFSTSGFGFSTSIPHAEYRITDSMQISESRILRISLISQIEYKFKNHRLYNFARRPVFKPCSSFNLFNP
jgi:hypothetical protein